MTTSWQGITPQRCEPVLTEAQWHTQQGTSVLFVQLTPYYPFSLMQKSRLQHDTPFEEIAHQLYHGCTCDADRKAIESLMDGLPQRDDVAVVGERLAYYFTPFQHVVGVDRGVQFFGNKLDVAHLVMCRTTDRSRRAMGCLAKPLYFPAKGSSDQLTRCTTNMVNLRDLEDLTPKTRRYFKQLHTMASGESHLIKQLMASRTFVPSPSPDKPHVASLSEPSASFVAEVTNALAKRQFQLTTQLRRAEQIIHYQKGQLV